MGGYSKIGRTNKELLVYLGPVMRVGWLPGLEIHNAIIAI